MEVVENGFSFGQALNVLKSGGKVSRGGWNGNNMYLELQTPDENSKMKRPYIYIVPSSDGSYTVPWVASQADLLTDDWFEVETFSGTGNFDTSDIV